MEIKELTTYHQKSNRKPKRNSFSDNSETHNNKNENHLKSSIAGIAKEEPNYIFNENKLNNCP